jgi:hypothetical protein
MAQDDLKFRDELERVANAALDGRSKLIITLLSGTRYVIDDLVDLNIGKHLVSVTKTGDSESFFPLYSLCSVDVVPVDADVKD